MRINSFTPLPYLKIQRNLKRFREDLRAIRQKLTSTLPYPLFCALKALPANLTDINKLNRPALFKSFVGSFDEKCLSAFKGFLCKTTLN